MDISCLIMFALAIFLIIILIVILLVAALLFDRLRVVRILTKLIGICYALLLTSCLGLIGYGLINLVELIRRATEW
jgi:hypothetical protein